MKNFTRKHNGDFVWTSAAEGDVIEVKVRYNDGKIGGQKGVYVHVTPVNLRKDEEGVTWRLSSWNGSTYPPGFKHLALSLKRKNDKAVEAVAELMDDNLDPIAVSMMMGHTHDAAQWIRMIFDANAILV